MLRNFVDWIRMRTFAAQPETYRLYHRNTLVRSPHLSAVMPCTTLCWQVQKRIRLAQSLFGITKAMPLPSFRRHAQNRPRLPSLARIGIDRCLLISMLAIIILIPAERILSHNEWLR